MSNKLTNEVPEGFQPVVWCEEVHPKFKEFCILTTHKTIVDGIDYVKNLSLEERKSIFRRSLYELVKHTVSELSEHYEKKDSIWRNFCEDVVIFYSLRFVLMNKPIPVGMYSEDTIKTLNIH